MTMNLVFSWIGQIVAAAGGGAIIAFMIFRFLAKGWIESVLAKDLEAAKSEISLLAARRLKLHDREYVVFPEMWAKLNKAFRSLGRVVVSFREIPDFARMSDDELATWLDRSDLTVEERSFFERAKDKSRIYSRILDWRGLREARKDFLDFYEYLEDNRIFLSPDVKAKVDDIGDLINSSWVAKKMDFDGYSSDTGKSFMREAYEKYEKEAKPLLAEIEELVQSKIFPHGSSTPNMTAQKKPKIGEGESNGSA